MTMTMVHQFYLSASILCLVVSEGSAFVHPFVSSRSTVTATSCLFAVEEDLGRPATFLGEQGEEAEAAADDGDIKIEFIDEEEDDDDEETTQPGAGKKRWEALGTKTKQRLVEKGEAKAIANKKKREPAQEKKRRMMMYFKEKQQEKKKASKVERPLGFDERAPLTAFVPGMEVTGVVISLTNFGAYVDVGTECDGLLHISQITRDFFVEHPRQVLTPGDDVTVTVRSVSTDMKKMHLTMLNFEPEEEEEDAEDRIPLSDIEADDELWGELKRVTDYGAYIEVGASVHGFLHFMDHPLWEDGSHPSQFMKRGQRVRVWVSDVDSEQARIKLTANRPTHLPGPRIEF